MRTLSITSYQALTPNLARVIISYTGDHDRASMLASINEKFQGLAAGVENSFRPIQAGAAVGYIRSNREVRVVDALELKAGYRMLAKTNMMVDEKDQSLWSLRSGQGGTAFLTRQGQEDLSELLSAVQSKVVRTCRALTSLACRLQSKASWLRLFRTTATWTTVSLPHLKTACARS